MKLCVISNNKYIMDTLYQVPYLNQFKIENLKSELKSYDKYDLVIFVSIQPKKYIQNSIIISKNIEADLQLPFKLEDLISIIKEKLFNRTYLLKNITFTPSHRLMIYQENNILLTEKECNLILYLITNHPRNIPKHEVLKEIWNYSADTETTTLEVHISRIKQKLQVWDPAFSEFLIYKDNNLSINSDFYNDR